MNVATWKAVPSHVAENDAHKRASVSVNIGLSLDPGLVQLTCWPRKPNKVDHGQVLQSVAEAIDQDHADEQLNQVRKSWTSVCTILGKVLGLERCPHIHSCARRTVTRRKREG